MKYDPRDLFPFVKAARLGSFSAAARALQLTPSAVSKSVARLETALGARLFNRNTRQLQLSDVGSTFLETLAPSIDRIESAVETVTEMRRGPAGTVRISSITSFGKFFLLPLINDLQQRYPKIRLEIQFDDGTPDLISGGFDMVIRRGTARGARTVARKLAIFSLILVASPDYLRNRGTPRAPSDLAAHECVSIRFPSGKYARWKFRHRQDPDGDQAEAFTYTPQGRLIVSEQPVDALIEAAQMGLGIVAIAASFVLPLLRDGTLKIVLSDFHLERDVEVFLQYPHKELLAPKVRAVSDFLIERLKDDDRLTIGAADLLQFAAHDPPPG